MGSQQAQPHHGSKAYKSTTKYINSFNSSPIINATGAGASFVNNYNYYHGPGASPTPPTPPTETSATSRDNQTATGPRHTSTGAEAGAEAEDQTMSVESSRVWIDSSVSSYQSIHRIHGDKLRHSSYNRVRIAVLDTGYDPGNDFFADAGRRKRLAPHSSHWHDFAGQSSTPVDSDGHGSSVVQLVMQLAPFADIYVARVAAGSSGLSNAADAIVAALGWAVKDCNADIVSMSFGFEARIDAIKTAIRNSSPEDDRILFFAAVGNDGGNLRNVMFPANCWPVIPVFGTNARGVFMDNLNPPITESPVYGTLAYRISCCGKSNEDLQRTGTSYATAIMAGFAGTLLEITKLIERHEQESGDKGLSHKISTREGMLALFSQICNISVSPNGRCYLYPPHFLNLGPTAQKAKIVTACEGC